MAQIPESVGQTGNRRMRGQMLQIVVLAAEATGGWKTDPA